MRASITVCKIAEQRELRIRLWCCTLGGFCLGFALAMLIIGKI